jgi:hypothetical protein
MLGMTATPRRPRRQKLGDRLTSPDARAEEIACDHAVAPFDRVATEMDRTWGVDRLPELVSPETAGKYGSALAKLNAALDTGNQEDCAARAAVCIRGMQAMDREARAAGHTPMPSGFWMHEQNGDTIIIAQDNRDWPLIEKMHPGIPIFSLREVANALEAYGNTVMAVKETFAGSEIKSNSPISRKDMEDEIPPF